MLWDCIYLKDKKMDFVDVEAVYSYKCKKTGNKPGKYLLLKDKETGEQYYVKVPRSKFLKYKNLVNSSDINQESCITVQEVIRKKGNEYRYDVCFASSDMYVQYKLMDMNEKGFYEYNMDVILNKCDEYTRRSTKNIYSTLIKGSAALMLFAIITSI